MDELLSNLEYGISPRSCLDTGSLQGSSLGYKQGLVKRDNLAAPRLYHRAHDHYEPESPELLFLTERNQ